MNTEEKQVLETKIAELKKTLEEKKNTCDVLHAQHKKLQVTSLELQIDCVIARNDVPRLEYYQS